jgi:hypothetical protein
MGNHFLPASIDNHYRGIKLALWFFWIVVIMRGLQGLALIVGGPSIVRDADGIPLESFPIAAAQSIVTVFMISGLSRLVLSLLGLLVFVRYRSAIALMFAVLALDQLGKEILLYFYPLVRVGNPIGPTINLGLLILTVVGLLLSISAKGNPTAQH